jgi:iron complex outermembrane receptor protein
VATVGGSYSSVTSLTGGGPICQPALDPFSIGIAANPASLANVLTNEYIHGRSAIDTADAKIVGSLFSLPGGSAQLAVGGSWRREAISCAPDPTNWTHLDGTTATAAQALTQGGLIVDPFSASRNVTAQFAELRLPLTGPDKNIPGFYRFDIIGAVRHEHYTRVGDSTVPKVGFRWEVVPRQITFRGDYARSFTAPSLYAVSGPINFRTSQGPIAASGLSPLNYVFNAEDGNNPNLKPAHANSWTLGVVVKPDFVPHLKVDTEFNDVDVKGMPGGIGFNNILMDVNANGSASPFFSNIALGNFPGLAGASNTVFATPGALAAYLNNPANATAANTFGNLYIVDRFTNLGETRIKSLDFTTTYDVDTGSMGTISLLNQAALLLSYKFRALPVTGSSATNPAQLLYEFAGTTTQGGGAQGTLPRLRTYTTLDWYWKHWDFGIANTYIGPVKDIGAGGASFWPNYNAAKAGYIIGHVPAFWAWDLRASWRSGGTGPRDKGVRLTAGVNNPFTRMPPLSTNINPAAGAAAGATAWRAENNTDVATYGPIGRLIYVSAGLTF